MLSALVTYRTAILNQNNCTPIFAGVAPVEKSLSGFDFILYPNPNNGRATLRIHNGLNVNEITITNLIGQVVERLNLQGNNIQINNSETTFNLDLSNEPAGIYFVSIITSTGKTVKKLIKSDCKY